MFWLIKFSISADIRVWRVSEFPAYTYLVPILHPPKFPLSSSNQIRIGAQIECKNPATLCYTPRSFLWVLRMIDRFSVPQTCRLYIKMFAILSQRRCTRFSPNFALIDPKIHEYVSLVVTTAIQRRNKWETRRSLVFQFDWEYME